MGMLSPQQQAAASASMQVQPDDEETGEPPMVPPPGAPSPATGAPMSDQLANEDLAAMMQDPQVAQVTALLDDPNADPRLRQQAETMIALAARRRLAGV
jgi:hypothetical protein